MYKSIPFVENELKIIKYIPDRRGGADIPIRDTPVSSRENIAAMYYDKHPWWTPVPVDSGTIMPSLYNDRLGRGGPGGTTDVFGIIWEYVESAKGSTVRPGEPLLANANEWKDKVRFPNLDEWDWVAAAEEVKVNKELSCQVSLVNGFWFERLISFMNFAPAAVALIDEDQVDAVKSFFEASTDFAIKLVDKLFDYWPALNGLNIHDDWGSQRAPFFSREVADELIVPCMKALTEHIHAKGRYATLHSCGHIISRIECFIEGGFDSWEPQTMNDYHMLYDNYGDKIIIGVAPDPFNPAETSEKEQRRRAREHFDQFCKHGKPTFIGRYGSIASAPAFYDELYEYSRKKYGGF